MADKFAPLVYRQGTNGQMTNLAYQDDDIMVKSQQRADQNTVKEPVQKNSLHQRKTASELFNGTATKVDDKMISNNTQPTLDVKMVSEEMADHVNNKNLSTGGNTRNACNDIKEDTGKPLGSRVLSSQVLEDMSTQPDKRKLSSESSPGNNRGHMSKNSMTDNDSNSVHSPGCRSENSIQSPYTESVCLQMFDDCFDSSSNFTSRSSGSELESSVLSCMNLEDITEEDGDLPDTESVLADDVFSTATEGECDQDKLVNSNSCYNKGHDLHRSCSYSSKEKHSVSGSNSKSASPVKNSEKFTKIPVTETVNVAPVYKDDKGEKKQLLLKTDGKNDDQPLPPVVTKGGKSAKEETNNLIPDQDYEHDIVGVKQGSGTTESTDKQDSSSQKDRGKSSFHITHPREYDTRHDTRRTLVMQSADVIHCQFLDDDYDAYKGRRARLSVYSRDQPFMPPRSKDYLNLSCLVLCCCNPLVGIIAFSFSVAVNSTYEAGQYDRSVSFSKWSLRMSAVGIAMTCIVVLILLICYWPDNYRKVAES